MDESRRRSSERRPVGLQVRLAFGDEAEFVDRYATNISDGGIFIRSRDRRPVGSRLAFELRLRTGEVVFAGEGTVRWVQGLDARGLGVPGMGLQFDTLTDVSRAVLARILERRALEDVPPPVEGASPSSWRPLSEFPAPVVEEPHPEELEPAAPPVLVRVKDPVPVEAPVRIAPPPSVRPALPVALPIATPLVAGGPSSAPPQVVAPPVVLPPVAPPPVVPPPVVPPPVVAPLPVALAPAAAPPVMFPTARPLPTGHAPPAAPPVMVPVRAPAAPSIDPTPSALTASVLAEALLPLTAGSPTPPSLAAFGFTAAPAGGDLERTETTLPLGGGHRDFVRPVAHGGWPTPRLTFSGSVGLELGWSSVRVSTGEGGEAKALELGPRGGFAALIAEAGGRLLLGEEARTAMLAGAPGVRGAIRLLGQHATAHGLTPWRRRNLVELVATETGRAGVKLGGRVLGGRALVELLLGAAKLKAEALVGGAIDRAVVAVPAFVGDAARRELRDAAAACGLVIDRIVPTPAAAVLAAFGPSGRRRVLTVDWGEGAFEAAIVEQAAHVAEVVASGADPDLGLADADLALVEAILTQFEKETGDPVPEDLGLFERVREGAGLVRDALAESLEHELVLPGLIEVGLSRIELRQRVSRARHQALVQPLVDRAFEVVRGVLSVRGFGGADLDGIVFVGGGSRGTLLSRRLGEKLGRDPDRPVFALDAAARGAALVAQSAAVERFVLQGTVGSSVSVLQPGGQLKRVLDRQLALPIERPYTAITTSDGQASLELHVFQGDRATALENDYVGVVTIGPLPSAPRGEVRVTLLLELNDEGELSVRARDASTGRELSAMLDRSRRPEEALRAQG